MGTDSYNNVIGVDNAIVATDGTLAADFSKYKIGVFPSAAPKANIKVKRADTNDELI